MKKKNIFLSFLFVCFMCVSFQACKANQDFDFTVSDLTLSINETVSLEDYVKLTNCSLGDIIFKSNDESSVSISSDYKLVPNVDAVGKVVIVTARLNNKYSFIEIEVIGERGEFNVPQNLRYDEASNSIMWDKSEIITSTNQVITATDYTLYIKNTIGSNVTEKEVLVASNSYVLDGYGDYVFKVKANESGYNSASQYSTELTFKKLDEVKNLKYDDINKMFTWDSVDGATGYEIYINGIGVEVEDDTTYSYNIEGNKKYSVYILAKNNEQNVKSSKSQTYDYERLIAPTLTISSGLLTWTNVGMYADHYVLTIKSDDTGEIIKTLSLKDTIYDFKNIDPGAYSVVLEVVAKDNVGKLNSVNLSEIKNITKLKAPIVSFDNGAYQFNIDNYFEGKTNLTYTINSLSEVKTHQKNFDGKYIFDYNSDAGKYTFSARNLATSNNEINSEYSNKIVVEKLAKVSNLSHGIDEFGNYLIDFDNKDNYGEGKDLSVEYQKNGEAIKQTDSWNYDVLFANSGEYYITVKVNGTSNGQDYFAVSNQSILKVIRISDATLARNENTITWQRVDNAKEYAYKISKIDAVTKDVLEVIESKTSEALAYDLSSLNLTYGTYLFEIRPLAIKGNVDLYLNAKNAVGIEFTQKEKIATPILTYDRDLGNIVLTNRDLKATDYLIEIYNENNKIEYPLTFNSDNKCNISEFITDNGAGRYTFKVRGTNDDVALIFASEIGEIVINKLPMTTVLKILAGEVVEVASLNDDVNIGSLDSAKPYIITIDGADTNILNHLRSEFTVNVNYNAKELPTDNEYFINSEIAQFRLKRLTVPDAVTFESDSHGKYISIPLSLNTTVYTKLVFTQDGKNFDYTAQTTNLYLTDINIAGFDANKPFSVCAYYEPKVLDNIVSSEVNSIKSFNTDNIAIEKHSVINNLQAIEQSDNTVKISWNVVNNALYEIVVDDTVIAKDFAENSYTFDSDYFVDTSKQYIIKVKAISDEKIDGEYSQIKLQKLIAPQSVNISADERLSVIHGNNQSYVADIEYYVDDVLSSADISSYQGDFEVKVRIKAIGTVSNDTYFLSSDYIIYQMSRLSTPDDKVAVVGTDYDNKYISIKLNADENVKTVLVLTQNEKLFNFEATSENVNIKELNISGFSNKDPFDISYYYSRKNQLTALSQDEVNYLNSYNSESKLISKQIAVSGIQVTENGDIVEITWNKIDGINVAYRLTVDNKYEYIIKNSDFGADSIIKYQDLDNNFALAKIYKIKIATIDLDLLDSEDSEFTIERLACPILTVSETEDVKFVYTVGEGKLKEVQVKINGLDASMPLNLNAYNGTFDIQVKMISNGKTSEKSFVISSKTATFTFDRISSASLKPAVKDGNIIWADFENVTYKLIFSDGINNFSIDNLNTNTISVADTRVVNIIKQLNSDFEICVVASVGSFEIKDGMSHKLSSFNSEKQEVRKLEVNTNVKISATDDKEQKQVKISWDKPNNLTEDKFSKYIVTAYKQDKSTLVEGFPYSSFDFNATSIISDKFNDVATYYITVQTIGQDNVIYSDISEFVQTTRLNNPTNISITPTGYITFTGVEKAESYIIKFTSDNEELNQEIPVMQTSYQMQEAMLNKDFTSLKIEIIALGDGVKTLSSAYSEVYNAIRLVAPSFDLLSNEISYSNEYQIQNFTYSCQIFCEDLLVLNFENISNNTVMELQEDIYSKLPGEILNNQKTLTFVVSAISKENGFISSLSSTKSAVKLAKVEQLSFKKIDIQSNKKSSDFAKIHFNANIVSNAFKYILNIGAFNKTIELSEAGTVIDITFDDNILNQIDKNWTLDIYAKGGDDGNNLFLDSPISMVSGSKLDAVDSVRTQNGKLVWSAVNGSSDYLINLNNTTYYSKYLTLEEFFEGEAGTLNVNIKALGNLDGTSKDENVVLDSCYMESNYVCTKLLKPTNFMVNQGYFSFDKIDGANIYKVSVGLKDYLLTERILGQLIGTSDTTVVYTSDEMYNDLQEDKEYVAKVFAESDEENIIFSDKSNEITIKILPNINAGNINVDFADASNNKKDYTKSILHWNYDATVGAGHLLKIEEEALGNQVTILKQIGNSDFTLDKDKNWAVGNINLSVATLGGYSDGIYYLTSKYTQNYTITKLGSANLNVEVEDENVKYSWTEITNADAYYVLLDGQSVNYDGFTGTYAYNVTDNFGTGTRIFEKLEVVAISKNPRYISSSLSAYRKDGVGNIKILRPGAPDAFTIKNGTMAWNLNITLPDAINIANGGFVAIDKPFSTSSTEILNERVLIKFFDEKSQTVYGPYEINPAKLMKLSSSLKDYASLFLGANNVTEGFPSLKLNFSDFAENLPAGNYKVSVKLLPYGETERDAESFFKTGSAYNDEINVYVANAPTAHIEYSESDDAYYYVFNEIQKGLYSDFFNGEVNYSVVLEKDSGERELLENNSFAQNLTNANVKFKNGKFYINLTNYIEAGTITSEHKKIYVYVSGNSNTSNILLNGKVSNKIGITILNQVSAYITDGVISWTSELGGQQYKIEYYDGNETASKVFDGNIWYGDGLTEGKKYQVKIKAIGQQGSSTNDMTLSSKSVVIDQVYRLNAPTINVANGELTWENIANATKYFVEYSKNQTDYHDLQYVSLGSGENTTWQSTLTYNDGQCGYYISSIGNTLQSPLNNKSECYLSSVRSVGLQAVVLKSVENYFTSNGVLTWSKVARDDSGIYGVSNYKITFTKLKDDGTPEQADKIKSLTGLSYDCATTDSELFEYGKYVSYIQAYYETGNTEGFVNGVYYLIGTKKELEFEKLAPVKDINIINSQINWNYLDETLTDEYNYRLYFTADDKSYDKDVQTNYFKDCIEEILENTKLYNLKIRTMPKDNNGYVYSDQVIYQVLAGTDYKNAEIHQLKGINAEIGENCQVFVTMGSVDADGAEIAENENNKGPIITWSVYESGVSNLEIVYEVRYKVGESSEWQIRRQKYPRVSLESLLGSALGANEILYYQIRTIANADADYIPSMWSVERELTLPKPIETIMYNGTEQYFYWEMQKGTDGSYSKDITYIVNDYILNDDETVLCTYRYEIKSTDENIMTLKDDNDEEKSYIKFVPSRQGLHKMSVAVMVANSTGSALMSTFVSYSDENGDECVVQVGLFTNPENGISDGTENNPYIISSNEEFDNIKYRLQKPSYLQKYIKYVGDSQENIQEEAIYYFKQQGNLTLESENILMSQETGSLSFNASYDGSNNTITWKYDLNKNMYEKGEVSLFGIIEKDAIVKNLTIYANFSDNGIVTLGNNIGISIIANKNYGKILNCTLGDTSSYLEIAGRGSGVNIGLGVYNNYGTISGAINNYNLRVVADNYAYLGAISLFNYGQITKSANIGIITLNAKTIYFGGISAIIENDSAIISECFNSGKINVTLNSIAYIGGLVGVQNSGGIEDCYSTSEFLVVSASNNSSTYIGGLIGYAKQLTLKRSYVNVTKASSSSSNVSVYQVVGIVDNMNTQLVSANVSNVYYNGNNSDLLYTYGVTDKTESNIKSYTSISQTLQNDLGDKFAYANGLIKLAWEK